ncbi:HEPN domain-containing protein [Sphaerospermopsis torques-reginae]|uniref:HEPN domain-containing protein n=1 Tax=Sphaerospermopsis torques-reginae ITEP-024 TaxID=984208 RepID=A0ABX8WYD3_9CYAN|nr:HEPN domain-containing protein [Sphaerospermopsis torques-reginae]QYX31171.1 HEPN domain-containing protein [Sphaerospermopsis torques-reginae ITEP-024]
MNDDQKRLLEKAERSLQAAVELNQKGFAEFAVSRGYYAMFYSILRVYLVQVISHFQFDVMICPKFLYLIVTQSAVYCYGFFRK